MKASGWIVRRSDLPAEAEELAHYARACVDILFKFPFSTQELRHRPAMRAAILI